MRKKWVVLAGAVAMLGLGAGLTSADRGSDLRAWVMNAWSNVAGGDVHAATDFTSIRVLNSLGAQIAAVFPDTSGRGVMGVGDSVGNLRAFANVTDNDGGYFAVFNAGNVPTYVMDADGGFVSLTGDLAEAFPADAGVPKGSVMVIDPEHPGHLKPSTRAYDRRVAGVVSGANDYGSAITLKGLAKDQHRSPVTLSGTVYCRATNANGTIHAGDLLTTSSVPGHAMKVTDHAAAQGAILGKAMEDLTGETGLILVLASLQ